MSAEGTSISTDATAQLFAPSQALRLTSISRKAIEDFLADREAYEDAISAQPSLKPVSWRSCFPASFLRSLVRARIFGADVTDVTQLTDEKIKSKLETFAAGTKTVSEEEALADVKRNVRLDASEPDARLRIIMLSASYLELCDKRGWNSSKRLPRLISSTSSPCCSRCNSNNKLRMHWRSKNPILKTSISNSWSFSPTRPHLRRSPPAPRIS